MNKFLYLIVLLFISSAGWAQINHGGFPASWENNIPIPEKTTLLPSLDFEPPGYNLDELEKHGAYKFAELLPLQLGTDSGGEWTILENGDKIWRLRIKSQGAYSLNFVFSTFSIPQGGSVFVYDVSGEQLIGAFTSENQKESGILAISPLSGDELIVEYNEPADANFKGELYIEEVAHDYVGVFSKEGMATNSSGGCNVDVNCTDGEAWQKEKQAVCKLLIVNELCTGTLVNNTQEDETPYVLTANHCIESQDKAEKAVFIFNYEYSACEGDVVLNSQSVSGADLIATKNKDNGYLDFTLVKLSESVPDSYDPYFAGWDSRENFATSATCIHHPSGDVKKISHDYDSQEIDSYWGWGYDPQSFWLVKEWDTGTTEGGSSGSPLFDQNHRIIGTLTGGDANCDSSVNDYYQMMSFSYDKYADDSMQLKHWLDPNNTGVEYLDGFEPQSFSGKVTDLLTVGNWEEGDQLAFYEAIYEGEFAGYVSGTNIYQDNAKAEFFNQTKFDGRNAITTAFMAIEVATGNDEEQVKVAVLDEDLGLPGKELGSTTLPLSEIKANTAQNYSVFEFDPPVIINSSVFVALYLPQNEGDTLALITTESGVVDVNSAWELNYNNEWHPYNSDESWGLSVAHLIGIEIGRYTDIKQKKNNAGLLNIYPNPANENLSIEMDESEQISLLVIYDTFGRRVFQSSNPINSNRLELDVSNWPQGFYIIRGQTDNGLITQKIIIQ